MFNHKFRWFIMVYISIAFFINFLDRIVISIATEQIMEEYQFSATQWGTILSSFFWGLMPFALLSGILADKWGAKRVWAWGAAWWSIFTIATPLAFNYVTFILARILFGIGEGPSLSTGIRSITNWTSPRENATASSVAFLGVTLGPALGTPMIVWIVSAYSWEWAFYIMGSLGFMWLIGWQKWFTDHPRHNPYVSEREKDWLQSEQQASYPSFERLPLKKLLAWPKGVRTILLANLWGGFCFGYALYFLMTWLPGYLTIQRGLDLSSMGNILTIPWLGSAVALLMGGKLTDLLLKRTGNKRIAWAYWRAFWFIVIAICLFFTVSVESVYHAVILLTITMSANSIVLSTFSPVIADTVPEQAGSQAGFLQVAFTLPGIISPIVTGIIVDVTHSFSYAFYLAAVIMLSGMMITLFFLKPQQSINWPISETKTTSLHL